MKITGFRIGLVSARLRVPFKTALRTVDSVEDVIVELETSTGQIGQGGGPADGGYNRRDSRLHHRSAARPYLPQARRARHFGL